MYTHASRVAGKDSGEQGGLGYLAYLRTAEPLAYQDNNSLRVEVRPVSGALS